MTVSEAIDGLVVGGFLLPVGIAILLLTMRHAISFVMWQRIALAQRSYDDLPSGFRLKRQAPGGIFRRVCWLLWWMALCQLATIPLLVLILEATRGAPGDLRIAALLTSLTAACLLPLDRWLMRYSEKSAA